MTRDFEDSRRHALTASELLNNVEELEAKLRNLSADERLQLHATGRVRGVNEDLRWTVQLALAHAVTALALGRIEAA